MKIVIKPTTRVVKKIKVVNKKCPLCKKMIKKGHFKRHINSQNCIMLWVSKQKCLID